MILPDKEMPETEAGEKADIVLNPLGIINRLNLGQIIEQHLNFMGKRLVERLREMDDLYDMEDELFPFLKAVSPKFKESIDIEYVMMNRRQQEEFFEDIKKNGLYIHQSPFTGNTTMEEFKMIYERFPHLNERYKFKGVERPLVFGDLYFVRLKHETSNKTSIRATGLNNIKTLPSKSSLKKEKRILVSQTPIKLGEMEVTNLMIPRRGDLVEKLLKSYSTNEESRGNLISDLLTSKTPLTLDTYSTGKESINRQMLQKYLNVLELDLED